MSIGTRGISLRPVAPGDEPFLQQVFAGTRRDEMAHLPLSVEQKEDFLHMQFAAQNRHFQGSYPQATLSLILLDAVPAGRLYLDRRPDEIRVLDIALLPERRGAGIGTAVLGDVLREADGAGCRVTLQVARSNPARRLYQRLGFITTSEDEVYLALERPAAAARS
jgi:ribosomal protein S18 acetylase RimI-like enzyme